MKSKAKKSKTKKIVLLAIPTLYLILLVSCGWLVSPDIETDRKSKQVLKYLSNNDHKGLKSMMCKQTQSIPDIDRQIDKLLEFFDGKYVTYKNILGGDGKSVDNGRVTKLKIYPRIKGITTNTDSAYTVYFNYHLINYYNKEYVGISYITIEDSDGNTCTAGVLIE